jgi:hypothetical protein
MKKSRNRCSLELMVPRPTDSGIPSFVALREDKNPREVVKKG